MSNNKSFFDKDVGFQRQHTPLLFMPFLLLLCVTFILPTDLFSTAKWWEGQGWTLVWQEGDVSNPLVNALNDFIPGTAPAEAVAFSAAMIGFQFVVTLKIYQEGSWLRSNSPIGLGPLIWELAKRRESVKNINPSKMAWVAIWLFCVLFDAFTAYQYRSTETTSDWTTLLVHSVFYENVLSEILIGESLRGTITVAVLIAISLGMAKKAGDKNNEHGGNQGRRDRGGNRPSQSSNQGQRNDRNDRPSQPPPGMSRREMRQRESAGRGMVMPDDMMDMAAIMGANGHVVDEE